MQRPTRPSLPGGGGGRPGASALMKSRSSTLQRLGAAVSSEGTPPSTSHGACQSPTSGSSRRSSRQAAPPGAAPGGFGDAFGALEEGLPSPVAASPGASMVASVSLPEEPVVLTAASLKHVRRQRDALAEEKARLTVEIDALKAKLRDQRERVVRVEGELQESVTRESTLQIEVQQALRRAEELGLLNDRLEDLLAQREAELCRLREALEEQRDLAHGDNGSEEKLQRLQSEFSAMSGERDSLKRDLSVQAIEHERLKQAVDTAMAAAERAMAMHALHAQHVEQLRAAKLEEAIKEKMELHISMPKVTLSYNNSPPLLVSAEVALSEERVRAFLERQVFPHLDPMWVSLDRLSKAPDGSSKKAYSTKMLDRLSSAIKAFVARAQASDNAALAPHDAGGARG